MKLLQKILNSETQLAPNMLGSANNRSVSNIFNGLTLITAVFTCEIVSSYLLMAINKKNFFSGN